MALVIIMVAFLLFFTKNSFVYFSNVFIHIILILALFETNVDYSTDSGNFSVRGYLPLIQKDCSTHMHGLTLYVKERRTSFCTGLISRKLCRFLLMFSTSFTSLSVTLLHIDEVLSVNPSPNVFVFGDFNIHPLGKSDHVVSVSVDFPSNS